MYSLKAENSFDSAHFLADYNGKCRNIHGHRWRVIVEVSSNELHDKTTPQLNGMLVDFSQLKNDIKEVTDWLDHMLIVEKGTLKPKTMEALEEEEFKIIQLDFRPTAENMSKYFFDKMSDKGYTVKTVTVYETPNNSATYQLS